MEKKLRIAIQGYEGSFHQIVARRYFNEDIEIFSCDTFRQVTAAVADGKVDYGVMAIENSIAGTILPNLSLLQNSTLKVIGEYYLLIRQNLMALPGVTLEDITEVHSHPMALLQCVDYLDRHDWKLVETEDTAVSAKHIAENNQRNAAAIASDLAAELYGMEIIASDIHTIQNNYTRFQVIARNEPSIDPNANKASLYFKTNHTQGALIKVLYAMEYSSINMSKLQSSPIPSEPWHYMFHVDMEFESLSDYNRVIDLMQQASEELHVYGVYKRGEQQTQK